MVQAIFTIQSFQCQVEVFVRAWASPPAVCIINTDLGEQEPDDQGAEGDADLFWISKREEHTSNENYQTADRANLGDSPVPFDELFIGNDIHSGYSSQYNTGVLPAQSKRIR